MAERAITLSAELNEVIGLREIEDEDPLVETRDPSYLRAQAFTLFVRAYAECRRGVTYLRWHHGDAAAIVPTLYAKAKQRRGTVVDAEDEAVEELLDPGSVEETEPETTPGPAVSTMAGDARVDA